MIKQPMLAVATIPDLHTEVKYPCYLQPKLDGVRCVAINGVAYSRKMKPIPNKFIQKWFADNMLHGFDGELMVGGDFNSVQSAVMSEDGNPDFYYVVYDRWDSTLAYTLRLNELRVLTPQVLIDKQRILMINTDVVRTPEEVIEHLDRHVRNGYEGGMLRSMLGTYKQGKSTINEGYLLKLKSFHDSEATVIGFEERMTNTNEAEIDERGYTKRSSKKEGLVGADTLGSLLVKWGDIEFSIGSGFNDEQRKNIWYNKDKYLGMLVTFKYQELSKYGVPRFPTYKGFRWSGDV